MRQDLLNHYIKLTKFLGIVFGIDYEIALHDLSDINHSLVAIANGHISGRSVGAPLTNVALQIISDRSHENSDWRFNYKGFSSSNKTLRSSTYFIKDEGVLVGLLCINFDDSRYHDLADQVLKLCHPDSFVDTHFQYDSERVATKAIPEEHHETFFDSINATTGDAVTSILQNLGITNIDRLTVDDKLLIVEQLDRQGIFLLKSAVKDVAEALHCSSPTIYRYLKTIKESGDQNHKES